jgi:hypothetical protein
MRPGEWIPITLLGSILLSASPVRAQQTASVPSPSSVSSPSNSTPSPLARWIDLPTGLVAIRSKSFQASNTDFINLGQYYLLAAGQLKLDREGSWGIRFAAGTGRAFTAGWNATGIGAGDFFGGIYLKQLFLSSTPIHGLEVQIGGIGFNRGESTEITSYNNNGYLMGERVRLKFPHQLFFNDISFTAAYIGDIDTPNVIARFHRLDSSNYYQFLAARQFGKKISLSADLTSHSGTGTLREAVKLNLKVTHYLDDLLFENYQRLNSNPEWGCAVTLQRSISRVNLAGGYADIDPFYGIWNTDRMGRGKRIFLTPKVNLWRELSFSFYFTQAFDNDFPVTNQTRFDFILNYDFQKTLHRAGIF